MINRVSHEKKASKHGSSSYVTITNVQENGVASERKNKWKSQGNNFLLCNNRPSFYYYYISFFLSLRVVLQIRRRTRERIPSWQKQKKKKKVNNYREQLFFVSKIISKVPTTQISSVERMRQGRSCSRCSRGRFFLTPGNIAF